MHVPTSCRCREGLHCEREPNSPHHITGDRNSKTMMDLMISTADVEKNVSIVNNDVVQMYTVAKTSNSIIERR